MCTTLTLLCCFHVYHMVIVKGQTVLSSTVQFGGCNRSFTCASLTPSFLRFATISQACLGLFLQCTPALVNSLVGGSWLHVQCYYHTTFIMFIGHLQVDQGCAHDTTTTFRSLHVSLSYHQHQRSTPHQSNFGKRHVTF